ncbi:hypothetical protein QS257_14890 [Terrilactibacillus sp. S3-3]|nr:hypothetical protein QS257_14890 [Terrilactibacillus sp. S3-3]
MPAEIDTKKVVHLSEMLKNVSEEEVRNLLSSFSCEANPEVQYFLRDKAIQNEYRSFTKTYLVLNVDEPYDIVGYFSIIVSDFIFEDEVSRTLKDKITSNKEARCFPTLLICQLGRADRYKDVVSGNFVLQLCMKIAQQIYDLCKLRIVTVEFNEHSDEYLFDFLFDECG